MEHNRPVFEEIARFLKKKERKWFIFHCIVKSHSHIFSLQLSGCQQCQLAAWVIYHCDSPAITKQKQPAHNLSLCAFTPAHNHLLSYYVTQCPNADILWQWQYVTLIKSMWFILPAVVWKDMHPIEGIIADVETDLSLPDKGMSNIQNLRLKIKLGW